MDTSVAIIGHSFVRRFGDFLAGCHLPRSRRAAHQARYKNLRIDGYSVTCFGVGGATAVSIIPHIHRWLSNLAPNAQVVFLDIGSNDLCRRSSSPEQVAARIVGLAASIHTCYNVDYIIAGQILHLPVEQYPGYNAKVGRTNQELARLRFGNWQPLAMASTLPGSVALDA